MNIARFRGFVRSIARLVESAPPEPELRRVGTDLLRELVAVDDWLPGAFSRQDPKRYRQYLLHCDSLERFSIVSFVWGPGQSTPIHDHTVWGLIGVLRGAEIVQRYQRGRDGAFLAQPEERLEAGHVDAVSPMIGDIHSVRNAFDDRVSISIHVYGTNIGAVHRTVYRQDGSTEEFVSGYSNEFVPNLWFQGSG